MIEFWIAFVVTTIILLAINYGKKHSKKDPPKNITDPKITKAEAEHQHKLQETNDLITVILPTINNNK
ncbi:MAG: hypothetical protein QG645_748 [Patescibacteria group bacterium]|nr:hypothetical protein [Patescibacteria group bacterium]